MEDVIIIGGGVSGMFAAINVVKLGMSVVILEKNDSLGKKILITGNGRCNFTNEYISSKCYTSGVAAEAMASARQLEYDNGKNEFVDKVLSQYGNKEMLATLSELGMSYYVREGYYYPKTDEASTFRDTLISEVIRLGVKVVYNFNLRSIDKAYEDDEECFKLSDKSGTYFARKVIIAAGGNAAPKTGSSGDCYYYLKKLGHNVVKPLPALTTLRADYSSKLQGVNALAHISLVIDGKVVGSERGFIKYYKGMLSGIPIYQHSMYAVRAIDEGRKVTISVDFVKESNVEKAFLRKGISLLQALSQSINQKIVEVVLNENDIDGSMLIDKLDTNDANRIIQLFSHVNYEIIGFGDYGSAQCTSGGVDISEINPTTMESTICPNLYLTGEIIDIAGRCGGYNIQWAASTGVVAGKTLSQHK